VPSRENSCSREHCAASPFQAAVAAWGIRQLGILDAEDKLSVACEKGLSQDSVILALREAFQAMLSEFKVVTEAEKVRYVVCKLLYYILFSLFLLLVTACRLMLCR
jgi:preprotein translocase subunit SecA